MAPDVSTTFYMVTWLPSLMAPIFGRLSDLHAPSRRYIAAIALVCEAAFQMLYAFGLIDSLQLPKDPLTGYAEQGQYSPEGLEVL